jgi:hypothetical protein
MAVRVYPGLLERVAVGHILLGYLQTQPGYVRLGLRLIDALLAAPSTTQTTSASGQSVPDLLLARGVCLVLLGAPQQAVAALKRAESAAAAALATPSGAPTTP